jgi:hypothetical protein
MKSPTKNTNSFMDWIQEHERTWGNETYPARPNLEELLEAPVVVFWQPNNPKDQKTRSTVTLHENLDVVEQHLSKLLFRVQVELPDRRIVQIFPNRKPVRVKGVKVLFETAEETEA